MSHWNNILFWKAEQKNVKKYFPVECPKISGLDRQNAAPVSKMASQVSLVVKFRARPLGVNLAKIQSGFFGIFY